MTGEPYLYVGIPYKKKEIPVLISERDVEIYNTRKWWVMCNGSGQFVVGSGRHDYFHRVVTDCPKGMTVDHVNGDTLDNRRENLRVCTIAGNARNKGKHYLLSKGGTKHGYKKSIYKGVWFDKEGWNARITVGGENTFLGRFKTEIEAAHSYNTAAVQLHGRFARLNVIKE